MYLKMYCKSEWVCEKLNLQSDIFHLENFTYTYILYTVKSLYICSDCTLVFE